LVSDINRELYGRRWRKRGQGVRWVRAMEMQRRGVPHFHALLGGDGLDELRRLSYMDRWNQLAGFAKIEPPKDGGAVRGYCAKYVAKGGELDLGGPGMHDPTRTAWPAPIVRLRGEQRAELDDVRRLTTGSEYHALMEWARGHGGAEPRELLERVRQRVQELRGRDSSAAERANQTRLPRTAQTGEPASLWGWPRPLGSELASLASLRATQEPEAPRWPGGSPHRPATASAASEAT
jgi:hypothetical protein